MSLRDAVEAILKSVEGEMNSAYNRARAVCCGRPGLECCGLPEPEWDEADHLVMNTLDPVQRALRAALAEAEAPKAEPVAEEVIAMARRYQWLREHTVATGLSQWVHPHQFLDEAIDSAMQENVNGQS